MALKLDGKDMMVIRFALFRKKRNNFRKHLLDCDGVVLEIYLDYKFQWPKEGLNCESLIYEVVT